MTNTTPQKTKHHDKDGFTHVAGSYSNYIHLCEFMQINVNSCKLIQTKENIRNEVKGLVGDTSMTAVLFFMGHEHDGRYVLWKGSIDHERS